jgi:hypothetical protein
MYNYGELTLAFSVKPFVRITTQDSHKFIIDQEKTMIINPNSCFSFLAVNNASILNEDSEVEMPD